MTRPNPFTRDLDVTPAALRAGYRERDRCLRPAGSDSHLRSPRLLKP